MQDVGGKQTIMSSWFNLKEKRERNTYPNTKFCHFLKYVHKLFVPIYVTYQSLHLEAFFNKGPNSTSSAFIIELRYVKHKNV